MRRVNIFVFTIKVSILRARHDVNPLKHAVEAGSHTVKELANDGHWHHGDLGIKNAFGGTSLAAVTYYFDRQTQIRVYYQDKNLGLKEYGHNSGRWFEGLSICPA